MLEKGAPMLPHAKSELLMRFLGSKFIFGFSKHLCEFIIKHRPEHVLKFFELFLSYITTLTCYVYQQDDEVAQNLRVHYIHKSFSNSTLNIIAGLCCSIISPRVHYTPRRAELRFCSTHSFA